MIGQIARRLGFQTAVPVAAVDDWLLPADGSATPLAPRGGAASCLVDRLGRLQPAHRQWTLDWSLAAGVRWVAGLESERVHQQLIAPATLETTIETPSGTVVQRIAAAVVDGEPVAIVEFENRGGVAIAVGLVARPLVHGGRGYLGEAAASATELDLGEAGAVRYEHAASTAVGDGIDLLSSLPAADAGISTEQCRSRSGAAQAAAVFPLPHTAMLRVVVELADAVRNEAAVPSIDDVQRGWARHLEAGVRYAVGETEVADRSMTAVRGLLTDWPDRQHVPAVIRALSESGFTADATRVFADADDVHDEPALLAAVARWSMLGQATQQLDDLDRIIGAIGRAAHVAGSGAGVAGPGWLPIAFDALAHRLDLIDQPDVAARVRSLVTRPTEPAVADVLLDASAPLDRFADPISAARALVGLRSMLVEESPGVIDLLAGLPSSWRGRTIDVLGAPVSGGTLSFGVRWHGPRPALLWEFAPADADPVGHLPTLTAASIDPDFSSGETQGETLLADPGWPR
ncbi:MAG: hypothetical protein AAF567_14010 [Actinomycetota bacterium]